MQQQREARSEKRQGDGLPRQSDSEGRHCVCGVGGGWWPPLLDLTRRLHSTDKPAGSYALPAGASPQVTGHRGATEPHRGGVWVTPRARPPLACPLVLPTGNTAALPSTPSLEALACGCLQRMETVRNGSTRK